MATIEQLSLEQLTLTLSEEIHVRAPVAATFATLLEEMGPHNETASGEKLPMTIEPWPGGRWFRDLGDGNGHFWGVVQAIKRPTLLEICGPLFLSAPVVSNLQYRLTPADGGTLITFRHSALGFVPDDVRKNMGTGWSALHARVRRVAEQK
ncbi:MAG TPA: SRPBCC domain-containing protein [Vicinamibacterales bacterium]|nr:SRPBCC domain-containing protein [Vicinamibacterales bacterium]